MKKLNRTQLYFIIFWVLLVSSFLAFGTFLLLKASGYRFDQKTWRLEPTSLIYLDGQPDQAKITVNNQVDGQSLPLKISDLLPGQYDISVTYSGYYGWDKIANLTSGNGVVFDKIILFKKDPTTADVTASYNQDSIKNDYKDQSSALQIIGNEIWYKKKLVTRFSQTLNGAILAGDRAHIIMQLDGNICVMETDGTNVVSLIKLSSTSPTSFALYGNKLVYTDQDKIYSAVIY